MIPDIRDPTSALQVLEKQCSKVPHVLASSVEKLKAYDPSSPRISQDMKDAVEKVYLYVHVKNCLTQGIPPQDIQRLQQAIHLFDQKEVFAGKCTLCKLCVQTPLLSKLATTCVDLGADLYDFLEGKMNCFDEIRQLIDSHGDDLQSARYLPLWEKLLKSATPCSFEDKLHIANIFLWVARNLSDKINKEVIECAMHDVFNYFSEDSLSHPLVVDVLKNIFEMRIFPSHISFKGSFITLVLQSGVEPLYSLIKESYDESYLLQLRLLEERIHALRNTKRPFIESIREKNLLKKDLELLGIKPSNDVQKLIQSIEEREVKAAAWIESHKDLHEQQTFDPIAYDESDSQEDCIVSLMKDIAELCLKDRTIHHLIPLIYYQLATQMHHELMNIYPVAHTLNHLLLEKCVSGFSPLDKHRWYGGSSEDRAALLIPCLSEIFHEISLDTSLSEQDYRGVKETLRLMILSLAHAHITERRTVEFLEQIKDTDKPLLFLLNLDQHAMLCQIQGNTLTIYNSGAGLKHHPQHPETKKHQTHLQITFSDDQRQNIPSLFRSNTIDELYRMFFELGDVKEPSVSPIHYEQPQLHGSCSTQCFLSYFRERILSTVDGSDEHRLGVYKDIKTRLLSCFLRMHKPVCALNDERISLLTPHIEAKEQELHLEQSLRIAVQDKELFLSMMEALGSAATGDIDTPHARYATIRRVLRDVVYTSQDYPHLPSLTGTPYVKPLIDHLWQEKKTAECFLDTLPPPSEKQQKKLKKWNELGAWWVKHFNGHF